MHHRHARPPASARLGAAVTRWSAGLSRRQGLLLTMAVALTIAAAGALAFPAGSASPAASGQLALKAAVHNAPGAMSPTGPGAGGAAASGAADPAGQGRGDHQRQHPQPAAAPNPNCTLVVPANPTSPTGLTTPYQLAASKPGAGACHEANDGQAAFVEAAIINPADGKVTTYRPLVIDAGDRPATAPVPVTVPAGAVVGVWFGFNGDTLTLGGPGAASCVNGLPGSPFGQFAYCNAPAFFSAAHSAIAAKRLTIPALGTGKDGLPCPTTRDFSVVDQDQSDNLTTTYRIVGGRMAQDTPTTGSGKALTNASDEGLLAAHIDPALGCSPVVVPDQTNGGKPAPSLAMNELSAATRQQAPVGLVPVSDPMVQAHGKTSVDKTNLYRAGVDQPALGAGDSALAYCQNIKSIGSARLDRDAAFFRPAASPDAGSPNLLAFLTARLSASLQMLNCSAQR